MQKKPLEQYKQNMIERIGAYKTNSSLQKAANVFFEEIGIGKADYVYNLFWLGVPILQIPQDLQALQEIIWDVKPDLIIETGIAWGGSLLFSASMLAILEACGVIENGHVLGIDIEIRPHNKEAISKHPLSKKITMFEGSSIDKNTIEYVRLFTKNYKRIMVCLDSNHTHDHVLSELEAYAPFVSMGSYCMVGDTVIEDAPQEMVSNRPWCKGNNPKTAVWEFLKTNDRFVVDKDIENKLLITAAPDGYLRCVKD